MSQKSSSFPAGERGSKKILQQLVPDTFDATKTDPSPIGHPTRTTSQATRILQKINGNRNHSNLPLGIKAKVGLAVKVGAVALGFHVWGIDFIWVVLGFTFCYDILRGIFSLPCFSRGSNRLFLFPIHSHLLNYYRYDKVHFIIRSDYHGHAGAGSQGKPGNHRYRCGCEQKALRQFTRWNTPPVATCTTWSIPKQRKSAKRTFCDPSRKHSGIGRYYDDVNPEFMDAFEVALSWRQAEEQATARHRRRQRESRA